MKQFNLAAFLLLGFVILLLVLKKTLKMLK